jgi:hypothetical protein
VRQEPTARTKVDATGRTGEQDENAHEEGVMERSRLLAAIAALALLAGCESHDYTTAPGYPVIVATPTHTIVGSGVLATEARPVPGFTAVTVGAPFRVVLAAGGAPSLEVTADDNVLPIVRSEVRGDTLVLGFTPDSVSLTRTREIVCRVTVPELREAFGSGAAVLEIGGIDAERLTVDLSGASSASALGGAGELALFLSGASRWSGPSLRARTVRATLSGASFALQRVADSLRADVSGASTLEYLGDPVVVSNVSGASVVRRVGP